MRTRLPLLALLPALLLLCGCELEGFLDSDRYREDFQYTYDLKPGGRLTLENFNGSVEILSWEKDSVQISGAKYAATEGDLKDLKIEAQASEGAVRVRTVRPSGRYRNMGAKYFIRVPRKVELERIASSNGSIRVEDIEGGARLETSNGSVRMRKLAGRLDVRTSNGAIEGDEVAADAVLRTSNGAIRLTQTRGSVDASTSNGSINARIAKVSAQKASGSAARTAASTWPSKPWKATMCGPAPRIPRSPSGCRLPPRRRSGRTPRTVPSPAIST